MKLLMPELVELKLLNPNTKISSRERDSGAPHGKEVFLANPQAAPATSLLLLEIPGQQE